MVARRPICILLAMLLAFSFAAMAGAKGVVDCGGACCLFHDARIRMHIAEARQVTYAHGCCSGEEASACDVLQGCAPSSTDLGFFIVSRTANSLPAHMASGETDLLIPFDSLESLPGHVFSSGVDAHGPLFLLKHSLLC